MTGHDWARPVHALYNETRYLPVEQCNPSRCVCHLKKTINKRDKRKLLALLYCCFRVFYRKIGVYRVKRFDSIRQKLATVEAKRQTTV